MKIHPKSIIFFSGTWENYMLQWNWFGLTSLKQCSCGFSWLEIFQAVLKVNCKQLQTWKGHWKIRNWAKLNLISLSLILQVVPSLILSWVAGWVTRWLLNPLASLHWWGNVILTGQYSFIPVWRQKTEGKPVAGLVSKTGQKILHRQNNQWEQK